MTSLMESLRSLFQEKMGNQRNFNIGGCEIFFAHVTYFGWKSGISQSSTHFFSCSELLSKVRRKTKSLEKSSFLKVEAIEKKNLTTFKRRQQH